mmetsp:Transcript_11058/g.14377  ORF Transcript_11058/g.14377 Transcript_11058/m.14377 type:complete len:241 (+) Transcript_11058:1010-1732(+)
MFRFRWLRLVGSREVRGAWFRKLLSPLVPMVRLEVPRAASIGLPSAGFGCIGDLKDFSVLDGVFTSKSRGVSRVESAPGTGLVLTLNTSPAEGSNGSLTVTGLAVSFSTAGTACPSSSFSSVTSIPLSIRCLGPLWVLRGSLPLPVPIINLFPLLLLPLLLVRIWGTPVSGLFATENSCVTLIEVRAVCGSTTFEEKDSLGSFIGDGDWTSMCSSSSFVSESTRPLFSLSVATWRSAGGL